MSKKGFHYKLTKKEQEYFWKLDLDKVDTSDLVGGIKGNTGTIAIAYDESIYSSTWAEYAITEKELKTAISRVNKGVGDNLILYTGKLDFDMFKKAGKAHE